jgi:two-component system, sensor histidine kinase and response regulator
LQIGSLKPGFTAVPVFAVVSDTLDLLVPGADAKQIDLLAEVPEIPAVRADRDMLTTVLRNIVSNAIKFTPRGGKVTVTAEHQGESVTVKIADNGIGISPDVLETLFSPAATDRTRRGTEGEEGTGLGLPLCLDLVQRQGGTLTVQSHPGEGSTFLVTLPVSGGETADGGSFRPDRKN